jgi:hypothetical protein
MQGATTIGWDVGILTRVTDGRGARQANEHASLFARAAGEGGRSGT